MRLSKRQSGMTLIELLIAITISAIVFSILALVINAAVKYYSRTNEEVKLQLEAQTAITQISSLVMEASSVMKAGTTAEPDIRYLISEGTNYAAIVYSKADRRLYLIQGDSLTEAETTVPVAEKHLLANYVEGIVIETKDTAEDTTMYTDNTAYVRIDFSFGTQSYQISKKVKLRNAN